MRMTRFAVILVLLAATTAAGAPVASANASFDDGIQYCDGVAGRTICVALLSEACDLWVSAGFGGCILRV